MRRLETGAWSFLFASLFLLVAGEAVAAQLVGRVSSVETGDSLPGVTVQVFHSTSAEIVAIATTNDEGMFNIESLPSGVYRVRAYSKVECIGEYLTDFGEHLDVFATALDVSVSEEYIPAVWIWAQQSKAVCAPPIICDDPYLIAVSGQVVDAESETKEPAVGIRVRLKDAVSAVPFTEIVTDAEGVFSFREKAVCGTPDVKIRFADPAGAFLPEYFGANGADSFDLGEPVDLEADRYLDESLARTSPLDQVADLQEQIDEMSLPETVEERLNRLLAPVVSLLADENPNNDIAACGVLRGLLKQIDRLLAKGELLPEEADSLTASVQRLLESLRCR